MVVSIILRNRVYEFQNAKVARPRLFWLKFISLLSSFMFRIFVDRFEHSSDLCAMASKVLSAASRITRNTFSPIWNIRKMLPTLRKVLRTCVRKMRSRVRRVCGARARTSRSFLPSLQSPGAAAASPRRDFVMKAIFPRGLIQKKKRKKNAHHSWNGIRP